MGIGGSEGPITYFKEKPDDEKIRPVVFPLHLAILDALALPVTLINDRYIYEWVNSSYCLAHGKEPVRIIGKSVADVWGQDVFDSHIRKDLDRCFQGKEGRREAWVNFSALGPRYCETVYSPYSPGGNDSHWAIVVTYDITERKLAEERVENSERRFRSLSEASLEAIVFIENGAIVDVNQAFYRLFGYGQEEVCGRPALDFIAPVERPRTAERLQKRLEGNYETLGIRKDGSVFPIEVQAREFEENDRRIRISAVRDLTERKRIEKELKAYQEHLEKLVEERTWELRKSEAKYRNIFENAVEGIFQTTPDGHLLSANPALARMFGCDTPEELIRSISDVGIQIYADLDRRKTLLEILEKDGVAHNFELEAKTRDGQMKWACINVRAVRDSLGNIQYLEGTMEDVTERKLMEQALRESEERYRIAIEHSNDGVAITSENRHLYVNRRYTEMFGYERAEELVGEPLSSAVHPDDIDRVNDISSRRMRGQPAPSSYEFKGRRKNGSAFFVETSVASIVFQGKPASLAYMRDITERRLAEEAMLRLRREQEQLGIARTKALDHLAHEMQTPIAVIQGKLRLLKKRLDDDAAIRSIDVLERNVGRLSDLSLNARRTFEAFRFVEATDLNEEVDLFGRRLQNITSVPLDVQLQLGTLRQWLNQYLDENRQNVQPTKIYPEVQDIISQIKTQAMRDLNFRSIGEEDIEVAMDRAVLTEIVGVLLKNAVENTPDGGVVTVSLERTEQGPALHVIDTGVGIAEENTKYLFSGFALTKETDLYSSKRPFMFGAGGKGLDLLRVRLYGRRYGFEVSVKSQRCRHLSGDRNLCPGNINLCRYSSRPEDCLENGGTTFSLFFPVGTRSVGGLP